MFNPISQVRPRKRWTSAGLMLAHRLRRWANINPTLNPPHPPDLFVTIPPLLNSLTTGADYICVFHFLFAVFEHVKHET